MSTPPGGTQAEDAWQGPLGQGPGVPAPTPFQSGPAESKQTSASSNGKGGEKQGGGKHLRTNNEREHLPGAKRLTYIIPPNSYQSSEGHISYQMRIELSKKSTFLHIINNGAGIRIHA